MLVRWNTFLRNQRPYA